MYNYRMRKSLRKSEKVRESEIELETESPILAGFLSNQEMIETNTSSN
jgi:hypothetical protein